MYDYYLARRIRHDQTVLCGLQAKDGTAADREKSGEFGDCEIGQTVEIKLNDDGTADRVKIDLNQ